MVDEKKDEYSSKAGRIRKKSAKMLEMEELSGSFVELSEKEDGCNDIRDYDMDEITLKTVSIEEQIKEENIREKKLKCRPQNKQRRYFTAYKVWHSHMKNKSMFKHLNSMQLQRRLKEMWHVVGNDEKMKWRRKAQMMSRSGEVLVEEATIPCTNSLAEMTEAIDLAAHLRLLSESLNTIGNRLVEHQGKIAVQGSLSVLLDSLVCTLACMLGTTSKITEGVGAEIKLHDAVLADVAYIMPGIA